MTGVEAGREMFEQRGKATPPTDEQLRRSRVRRGRAMFLARTDREIRERLAATAVEDDGPTAA